MGNCIPNVGSAISDIITTRQLRNATNESVKIHSMNGLKTKAKVVDVYDGDTITVVMKYNNRLDKFKIRMYGYDAPEMKPLKSKVDRDLEIEAAKKAKALLSDMILNKIVMIDCLDFDKYGRLLGNVYTIDNKPINVNEYMLKCGHCVEYFGGTKQVHVL